MPELSSNIDGSAFACFMASGAGRGLRVVMGVGLIATGLGMADGPVCLGMAIFGILPIAPGSLNLCPMAPMWGGHFFGATYCGVKRPNP